MLALQSLADPGQASYHNHTVRELALAVFALAAVEGHPSVEARAAPLRAQAARALDNILETTDARESGGRVPRVDGLHAHHLGAARPDGGAAAHDHRRRSRPPLRRVPLHGPDVPLQGPARRIDGARRRQRVPASRRRGQRRARLRRAPVQGPVRGLDARRRAGGCPSAGGSRCCEFLWRDDTVVPRDPAATTAAELPRERLFPGIGHVVLRDGWGPDSTWIEFSCGPYFAKHDHLDTNQFVIYHKGHLALDSGADYTDTESPHYLNYYRRTVAHNTMLVYQPGETFFWGENKWPAANDGGQRMDSSRFWNSVRSLEDWRRTRDLWDRGRIEAFDPVPGRYTYVRGDGTGAYHPSKVERFVRELAWLPRARVLFVLDRVRSADPGLPQDLAPPRRRRAEGRGRRGAASGRARRDRSHGDAPRGHVRGRRRAGCACTPSCPPGATSSCAAGRASSSGRRATSAAERGAAGRTGRSTRRRAGRCPPIRISTRCGRPSGATTWRKLSPSNRRAVVPGGWRIEVSPRAAARDDVFLSVLEIGDRGAAPLRIDPVTQGKGLAGAVVAGEAAVLLATGAEPLVGGRGHAARHAERVPAADRPRPARGLRPAAHVRLRARARRCGGSRREANDAGVIETPWDGQGRPAAHAAGSARRKESAR